MSLAPELLAFQLATARMAHNSLMAACSTYDRAAMLKIAGATFEVYEKNVVAALEHGHWPIAVLNINQLNFCNIQILTLLAEYI